MRAGKKRILLKVLLPAAVLLAGLLLAGCSRKSGTEKEEIRESGSEPVSEDQTGEDPLTVTLTEEPTPSPVLTEEPAPSGLAERLEELPAGTAVAEEEIDRTDLSRYFQSYEISDPLFARIYGDDRSYKTYCTVPREDLRYIKVLHYGYDGQIYVGELVVNALLAEDIKAIFQELFENQYEIEKMHLIDDYGADDNRSIDDNNTSCFNFRLATNAGNLSNHAAGCAVDINPKQNPYYVILEDGSYVWENEDAELYIDRTAADAAERHMITHEDLCYQIFTQHGFSWGGDWGNPVDYQHFEKVVYLAEMPDTAVAE